MEHRWNEIDRGKPKYSGRGGTYPSAALSAANSIWIDPGSNPGLRGGRPVTNRLSHGTLFYYITCFANSCALKQAALKIRGMAVK
jgi:hypothetical protein